MPVIALNKADFLCDLYLLYHIMPEQKFRELSADARTHLLKEAIRYGVEGRRVQHVGFMSEQRANTPQFKTELFALAQVGVKVQRDMRNLVHDAVDGKLDDNSIEYFVDEISKVDQVLADNKDRTTFEFARLPESLCNDISLYMRDTERDLLYYAAARMK